jgi:hypothetical protein
MKSQASKDLEENFSKRDKIVGSKRAWLLKEKEEGESGQSTLTELRRRRN